MDKGMYGKIKIAAAVLVALLILVAAFSEYVALTRGHQVHRVIYLTNPRISIHPINQDNLFYDNGSYVLPLSGRCRICMGSSVCPCSPPSLP